MSKRQIIMLLGVFVILLPLTGLTSSWKLIVNAIIGLAIIIIAYRLYPVSDTANSDVYKKSSDEQEKKNENLPFVDYHSEDVNRN